MGQFSWMYADTDNKQALHEDGKGYLALPEGGFICEPCYEGYGEFDGQDVYDLVADWNRAYLSEHPDFIIREGKSDEHPVSACLWYEDYADLALSREQIVNHMKEKRPDSFFEYRFIGIEIACYDEDNAKLPFPIKICSAPVDMDYASIPASESDPNQGWGEDNETGSGEHQYKVTVTQVTTLFVNADSEQEALDIAYDIYSEYDADSVDAEVDERVW